MQEIKCPKCGEVFTVDESGYAAIIKQVRDKEFEEEITKREKDLKKQKETEIELAVSKSVEKKNKEISDLNKKLAEKEQKISELNGKIDNATTEKELAVTKAIQKKDQEISDKNSEIAKLKGDIDLQKKENQLSETNLLEKHKGELALRDEEIERLKDFKARQSTKMVGETLEQHCSIQFNQIRMTAFPNAYFEKDNDAKTGSKGDFIFRDYSDDTEYISIMFEMKNEMDTTATKHKNEDFFKELDKDRKEKGCEYAVLVSMLEADNELYNNGIVDVSYRYPKMYVIRPQFFIPLITILRNTAMNSLSYQKELQIVKNQQIDLFNFEENLEEFKNSFADSFRKAGDRFSDAIKGIDNTIKALTTIRENLVKSENHLNSANNKLEGVSIKKLTKNAPSVRKLFDELKEEEKQ